MCALRPRIRVPRRDYLTTARHKSFDWLGLLYDRQARADGQRGELIDYIAAGAPVRQLLGHARVSFAGFRPDHRAGIKLAAIDAHRAAEAAADLEGRLECRARALPWPR